MGELARVRRLAARDQDLFLADAKVFAVQASYKVQAPPIFLGTAVCSVLRAGRCCIFIGWEIDWTRQGDSCVVTVTHFETYYRLSMSVTDISSAFVRSNT